MGLNLDDIKVINNGLGNFPRAMTMVSHPAAQAISTAKQLGNNANPMQPRTAFSSKTPQSNKLG